MNVQLEGIGVGDEEGLGDGLGEAEALGEAEGEADGLAEAVGEALAVGEGEAEGDALTDAVGDVDAVVVTDGEAAGLGVIIIVTVALGTTIEGLGTSKLALALAYSPPFSSAPSPVGKIMSRVTRVTTIVKTTAAPINNKYSIEVWAFGDFNDLSMNNLTETEFK